MLNKISNTLLLTSFFLISITFFSCKKEKSTVGVVIVRDGSGNPVKNARVVLHANPLKQPIYFYQLEIDEDGEYDRDLDELVEEEMDTIYNPYTGETSDIFVAEWTDGGGRAEFNLPLEMILNISVLKVSGNNEYLAQNVINIEKGKTVTQNVRLLNY